MKKIFCLLVTAMLAGCSVTQLEEEAVSSTGSNLRPLLDAADRTTATCSTVQPLCVSRPTSALVFKCASLDVSATLAEIKDAGWRIESIDIGPETAEGEEPCMPITVTVKKLF